MWLSTYQYSSLVVQCWRSWRIRNMSFARLMSNNLFICFTLNSFVSLRKSWYRHTDSYVCNVSTHVCNVRAASAGSSWLHISSLGIGVDGERGYNSSHCIGSLWVIGTPPPCSPASIYSCLSRSLCFTLSRGSLPSPSYASLPTVVSHFTKAWSARYYARYAGASLFYRHCGQLHRICPFCALPVSATASGSRALRPTNFRNCARSCRTNWSFLSISIIIYGTSL